MRGTWQSKFIRKYLTRCEIRSLECPKRTENPKSTLLRNKRINSVFLTKWPPTWTDNLKDILIWFQRLWNQAKIASWPKYLANSRTNRETLILGSKWFELAETNCFFHTWNVLNLVTPWSMIYMHLHVCLCNRIISQKYKKEEGEFWGTTNHPRCSGKNCEYKPLNWLNSKITKESPPHFYFIKRTKKRSK